MRYSQSSLYLTIMKKILSFLLVIGGLLSLPACSTDFVVSSDWEEITVVYGLLSVADDVHYLRVNKAFLSENTSALEIAQVPDSLYHNGSVNVKLEQYSILKETTNTGKEKVEFISLEKTINLERVDAAEEGIVKEGTTFANNPYYIYKTTENLNPEKGYKLIVNTPGGNNITAQTLLVKDFDVLRPRGDAGESPLNLLASSYTTRWKEAENGFIYDLDIIINFREQRFENGGEIEETRSLKWNIFSNFEGAQNAQNGRLNFDVNSESLFNFIAQNLDAGENIKRRYFESLDFVYHVGSQELKNFNDVTRAQLGITSSQVSPEYTNITNGLGLFTTRYSKKIEGVKISGQSLGELGCGSITGHLRFASNPDNPNFPDC